MNSDFVCMCLRVHILQCIAGYKGENPENEGLRGKVDGVSGGATGEARPSPSE